MGLFVLLSMPSSGGTIPVSLVPPFFAALHPLMPMGNLVDALRGLFYFNGVGVGRPVAVLCAWMVFGFALIGADVLRQRHRLASENAQEVGEIAEPPVEDPALEMPQPTASTVPRSRRMQASSSPQSGRPMSPSMGITLLRKKSSKPSP